MNQSLTNQNVSHFLLISHDCVAFDLVKNRSQTGAEELIKQKRGSSAQSRDNRCYSDIARSLVMIYTRKNKTRPDKDATCTANGTFRLK